MKSPEATLGRLMTKYVFEIDDGAHNDRIKEFTDLEEAQKYFKKEEQKAMADPEKYFGQSKEDWDENFYPSIELNEYGGDTDEELLFGIDFWDPTDDD